MLGHDEVSVIHLNVQVDHAHDSEEHRDTNNVGKLLDVHVALCQQKG